MKNKLIKLAEGAINFQVDFPYSPKYVLRYFEWLTPYYSFLYLVSDRFKPKLMVELGTNCGMGSIHLALGNPNGKVVTIDTNKSSKEQLTGYGFGIENIEILTGHVCELVERFEDESIDILFIDNDHCYDDIVNEYVIYFPKVAKDGIILIDDIQLSDDMKRFWYDIPDYKFDLNFMRPKDEHHPGRGVGFGVVLKGETNEITRKSLLFKEKAQKLPG